MGDLDQKMKWRENLVKGRDKRNLSSHPHPWESGTIHTLSQKQKAIHRELREYCLKGGYADSSLSAQWGTYDREHRVACGVLEFWDANPRRRCVSCVRRSRRHGGVCPLWLRGRVWAPRCHVARHLLRPGLGTLILAGATQRLPSPESDLR